MAENHTEKKDLTPRQRRAVEILIATGSVSTAATAAGVTRQTVHKWKLQPEFSQAMKEAEAAALAEFSRRLVTLASLAADALADGLDKGQDIKTRLRAAETVVGKLITVRELVDFDERLQQLEKGE